MARKDRNRVSGNSEIFHAKVNRKHKLLEKVTASNNLSREEASVLSSNTSQSTQKLIKAKLGASHKPKPPIVPAPNRLMEQKKITQHQKQMLRAKKRQAEEELFWWFKLIVVCGTVAAVWYLLPKAEAKSKDLARPKPNTLPILPKPTTIIVPPYAEDLRKTEEAFANLKRLGVTPSEDLLKKLDLARQLNKKYESLADEKLGWQKEYAQTIIKAYTAINITDPVIFKSANKEIFEMLTKAFAQDIQIALMIIDHYATRVPLLAQALSSYILELIMKDTHGKYLDITREDIAKLIEFGANIFQLDAHARYPIIQAFKKRDALGFIIFDKFYALLTDKMASTGEKITPLLGEIITVFTGLEDLTLQLIDHFAPVIEDINGFNPQGVTTLHSAVLYGTPAIIEKLLEYGADPHLVCKINFNKADPSKSLKESNHLPAIKVNAIEFASLIENIPAKNALASSQELKFIPFPAIDYALRQPGILSEDKEQLEKILRLEQHVDQNQELPDLDQDFTARVTSAWQMKDDGLSFKLARAILNNQLQQYQYLINRYGTQNLDVKTLGMLSNFAVINNHINLFEENAKHLKLISSERNEAHYFFNLGLRTTVMGGHPLRVVEIAVHLLAQGADPFIKLEGFGEGTTFDIAKQKGNEHILKLFNNHQQIITPDTSNVYMSSPGVFRSVLFMSLEEPEKYKNNPLDALALKNDLRYSILARNLAVSQAILENNLISLERYVDAFKTAILIGDKSCISLLAISARKNHQTTAISIALIHAVLDRKNLILEFVEFLLDLGADPNFVYEGKNALMVAQQRGLQDVEDRLKPLVSLKKPPSVVNKLFEYKFSTLSVATIATLFLARNRLRTWVTNYRSLRAISKNLNKIIYEVFSPYYLSIPKVYIKIRANETYILFNAQKHNTKILEQRDLLVAIIRSLQKVGILLNYPLDVPAYNGMRIRLKLDHEELNLHLAAFKKNLDAEAQLTVQKKLLPASNKLIAKLNQIVRPSILTRINIRPHDQTFGIHIECIDDSIMAQAPKGRVQLATRTFLEEIKTELQPYQTSFTYERSTALSIVLKCIANVKDMDPIIESIQASLTQKIDQLISEQKPIPEPSMTEESEAVVNTKKKATLNLLSDLLEAPRERPFPKASFEVTKDFQLRIQTNAYTELERSLFIQAFKEIISLKGTFIILKDATTIVIKLQDHGSQPTKGLINSLYTRYRELKAKVDRVVLSGDEEVKDSPSPQPLPLEVEELEDTQEGKESSPEGVQELRNDSVELPLAPVSSAAASIAASSPGSSRIGILHRGAFPATAAAAVASSSASALHESAAIAAPSQPARTRKKVKDSVCIEKINQYLSLIANYLDVQQPFDYINYALEYFLMRYFYYLQQFVCNKKGQAVGTENECINFGLMLGHGGLQAFIDSEIIPETAALIRRRKPAEEKSTNTVIDANHQAWRSISTMSASDIRALPLYVEMKRACVDEVNSTNSITPQSFFEKLIKQLDVIKEVSKTLLKTDPLARGRILDNARRHPDKDDTYNKYYFHIEAILRNALSIIADAWVPLDPSYKSDRQAIIDYIKSRLHRPKRAERIVDIIKMLDQCREIRRCVRHEPDTALVGHAINIALSAYGAFELSNQSSVFKTSAPRHYASTRQEAVSYNAGSSALFHSSSALSVSSSAAAPLRSSTNASP